MTMLAIGTNHAPMLQPGPHFEPSISSARTFFAQRHCQMIHTIPVAADSKR